MNNPWIEISRPAEDISGRLIDHKHPLKLYWGKDQTERYLFICDFQDIINISKKNLPELSGITIKTLIDNESLKLCLVLKDKANWEIFYSMCIDLVETTRKSFTAEGSILIILNRLKKWCDFLKKTKEILNEDEIKGLIGELFFILKHLYPLYGIDNAINFWIGPEGAPQDFNINDSAIEVKCQMGGTAPYVKISSIDQLESQLSNIFLFVVTLGKTTDDNPNSLNLPELIDKIKKLLEDVSPEYTERFQNLLLDVGYYDSEKYLFYNYILSKEQIYKVNEDFPRILSKEIRTGVSHVNYSISLEDCVPYEIDINKWEDENDRSRFLS